MRTPFKHYERSKRSKELNSKCFKTKNNLITSGEQGWITRTGNQMKLNFLYYTGVKLFFQETENVSKTLEKKYEMSLKTNKFVFLLISFSKT